MASASILVVDDEPLVLQMIGHMLKTRGYQVLRASRPMEALELVASGQRIDVLLSDIVMPDMPGGELVERVQQRSPSIAPILMSGYSEPGVLPSGVPFLRKPFSVAQLTSVVETALAGSTRPHEE